MKFLIFIEILFSISLIYGDWIKLDNRCLCKEFRCDNGTFCLHKTRVCNGVKDCLQGEDEIKCNTPNKIKCTSEEFKCKFGGCIKLESVCDGVPDCYGGVDEATDFCEWVYGNGTNPELK